MIDRSIESTVTFAKTFSVGKTTGQQPPGIYRVTFDEEEILGISTLAYRRVATLLHTPFINGPGPQQTFYVQGADLEAALAADHELDAADQKSM